MNNDLKHIFMCLFDIFIFIGEVPLSSNLLPISLLIACFLVIEFWEFFINSIFWIGVLYEIYDLQIISPSLWLIFPFS